jgi:hypothetical protein
VAVPQLEEGRRESFGGRFRIPQVSSVEGAQAYTMLYSTTGSNNGRSASIVPLFYFDNRGKTPFHVDNHSDSLLVRYEIELDDNELESMKSIQAVISE